MEQSPSSVDSEESRQRFAECSLPMLDASAEPVRLGVSCDDAIWFVVALHGEEEAIAELTVFIEHVGDVA